jgi:uncharacterized protein
MRRFLKIENIFLSMEIKKNAVIWIAAVNLVFFALQLFSSTFENMFILVGGDVFSRPWILITSMFLHGSMSHLFFNMISLIFLGPLLEGTIGTKRFLMIYFGSGIVAGLIASFFYPRALGASGALMGMFGVMIVLMPRVQLLIYGIVPVQLWLLGIIYVFMDTFGIFFPSGTGNIAHLSGMAMGLLYGVWLKKQSHKFQRKFFSKKHLDGFDADEYLKSGRI